MALCHDGPASRAELSRRLGLSPSHVSEAVNDLLKKEVLIETGYRKATARGRKSTVLDFNLSYKFALGVGYDENLLSIGVATVRGDVLGKQVTQVDQSLEREEVLKLAFSMTAEILRNCCLDLSQIMGVGICFKQTGKRVFYADATLAEAISDAADFIRLPALFEPAEQYLDADPRISPVRPEELYLFGAAKAVRDLFLYADI